MEKKTAIPFRQAKMLVLTCVSKNGKRGNNYGTDKMSGMWTDDFR